jgi:hypothetical protein
MRSAPSSLPLAIDHIHRQERQIRRHNVPVDNVDDVPGCDYIFALGLIAHYSYRAAGGGGDFRASPDDSQKHINNNTKMQQVQLGLKTSQVVGRPVRPAVKSVPARIARGCVTKAVAEPPTQEHVPFLSSADHLDTWGPDSWKNFPALQQPAYPDKVNLYNLHTSPALGLSAMLCR